jgi:phenylpropionate dioxygenase-like ring-hydroxylating dioxygenase large terminal subunit
LLTNEDNQLISRVGPGTVMGNLMREYWIPAMLSSELPRPDSDPVRVLLLGKKLIGFRDSTGKVGLLQTLCPHRGASLYFGRNEQGGLRCIYHGWKFDHTGACVDMPNEPAESNFKELGASWRVSMRRAQRPYLGLHGTREIPSATAWDRGDPRT